MARAAVGKQIDDEVRVQTPTGTHNWYIIAIHYQRTKSVPEKV